MRFFSKRGGLLIAVAAAALMVTACCSSLLLAGDSRTAAEKAAGAAGELLSLVSRETSADPGAPGSKPHWIGAGTGAPFLVNDIEGNPSEYIVPVVNSGGKVVSTIGVGAVDNKWHWYCDYTLGEFPYIDLREAKSTASRQLGENGIDASLSGIEARLAPDKNVYWFVGVNGHRRVKELYLPVFLEPGRRMSTNLGKLPWKEAGKPGGTPAPEISAGNPVNGVSGEGPRQGNSGSSYKIANVPYHKQQTSYWCGPASLQMVFDYFGPDIDQAEIAGVADASESYGCYNTELLRAAQFSDESTSIQDDNLQGYSARSLGYGAADAYWSTGTLGAGRWEDIKRIVSSNYPLLVLSNYDVGVNSGHFRVITGYNENTNSIIFNDPWYTAPIYGPDVSYNKDIFIDRLWTYSNRWGMITCPWRVSVEKPAFVEEGQVFSVTASASYPGPSPLDNQYDCLEGSATATFMGSSTDYDLLSGQVNQEIPAISGTGSSGTATWTVQAQKSGSTDDLEIRAQGMIQGETRLYNSYTDSIGGAGSDGGVPPETSRNWAHDSIGVNDPSTTWYLAEGCTKGGFETWVMVQNPNNIQANVELTYMTSGGPVAGPSAILEPNSRATYYVGDTVPDNWNVSTMVRSSENVIVERAMYGGRSNWGHDSIGVSEASDTWYLAEGCTNGGFETWVLVQNPGTNSATVNLTYMTPAGPVKGQTAVLKPNSRETFNAADVVPGQWSVSTGVTASDPVIVERSMYGGSRSWAHDSIGVPEAFKTWYLAEGCTNGGFETWILVQNPNNEPAEVSLTYMTRSGPVKGQSKTLPANSRYTFNVSEAVPETWEVSTKVASGKPIIAERAMYGDGRAWGHDSIGVTAPSKNWYLAEGCTNSGFETWVLVQNPNDNPAKVSLTFMTSRGPITGPKVTIPADSRQTFNVWSYVPGTWEVSTRISSDLPVVAERAMYGDPRW